jgi:hypothetical protein
MQVFKDERIPPEVRVVIDKVGMKYVELLQGRAGGRSVVAYAWICVGFNWVSRQQSVKSIRQEKKSSCNNNKKVVHKTFVDLVTADTS